MSDWETGSAWSWVFAALVVAGAVLLVVVLVRVLVGGTVEGRPGRIGPERDAHAGAERARRILAERYARGEISNEEYESRMRALEVE